MSVELFLNIIVILLLIPTIVFALLLNKRLEILRNSRADLGRLIEAFNDATTRAEAGIPRLKQAADSTGALLREQIQKAQTLRDDLSFMLERADSALDRLDAAVHKMPQKRPFPREEDDDDRPQAPAPSEKAKPRRRALIEDPEELMSSAVSLAEDILRETEQKVHEDKPFVPAETGEDGERSEAERELLRALQAMR